MRHTFLNYITSKFVLTKSQHFSIDLTHYLALVFGVPMLKDMLNDIVSILVLKIEDDVDGDVYIFGISSLVISLILIY